MAFLKSNSLERHVLVKLFLLALPYPAFFAYWAYVVELATDLFILGEFLLLFVLSVFITHFHQRILASFSRATLHLDAINQEDYNQFAKPEFPEGKVNEFHQQLNTLSTRLQHKKYRYDQHAYLVYQLIEQIDTPMLVFNRKMQLSFANEAFYQLYA